MCIRDRLYTALEELDISKELIRLCRMTVLTMQGMVRIQKDLSGEFEYGNGVLQGDALACLLFILALENAMRDAGIDSSGTVFNRLVQVLGYADDLDIIGRLSLIHI